MGSLCKFDLPLKGTHHCVFGDSAYCYSRYYLKRASTFVLPSEIERTKETSFEVQMTRLVKLDCIAIAFFTLRQRWPIRERRDEWPE